MKILDKNNALVLEVEVDDNSFRYREIRGDNNLTLYFALAEHVEIPVGAYVTYQGMTYTLLRPEALKMQHTRNFEYTIIFESSQSYLEMYKFREIVTSGVTGASDGTGKLKFNLTAQPQEHLAMVVANMNQRESGWTIGKCITGTEKLVSYNHNYCIEALNQIAEAFDTEWEVKGKEISLCKVEYNKESPLALSYGKGNGFKPGVGRSNYDDNLPIEIVYPQGGSRNIDASKYGNTELLLPKGQSIKYDGTYFEGEAGFNAGAAKTYIASADGMSVQRSDKALTTKADDSLDCTDIYPSRVGTISDVVVVDADKNFYDIVDSSIPSNLNYEDYLIEGETMTVIFQSGMLSGRELDVKYVHEMVDGKAARRFEIVPTEIDGQTMPNSTFKPGVGDKYAIFGCMLPDAYICDNATKTGASWDMMKECVRYLYENEEQKLTFTGELDGIWAKKDWLAIGGKIVLGGYISFTDARFQTTPILIRIKAIKDYVNNPHSPEVTLSNSVSGGNLSSTLKKLESNEVLMEQYKADAINYTKRRWNDVKAMQEQLESDFKDQFSESINPVTVETMQLIVGSEQLQFIFVDSKNEKTQKQITVYPNINAGTGIVTLPAAILKHMTIGVSTTTLSSNNVYKYWDVAAYTSPALEDDKLYRLYVKANKSGTDATFLLSDTLIDLEGVSGYYHFLMGYIGKKVDGLRSWGRVYGFTEVLPGQVTTEIVQDPNGNLIIDLVNGHITGAVTITAGSSGYKNLQDTPGSGRNMVVNSDFADDLSHWWVWEDMTYDFTFRDNVKYLHLNGITQGSNLGVAQTFICHNYPLDDSITVSFIAYAETDVPLTVFNDGYDDLYIGGYTSSFTLTSTPKLYTYTIPKYARPAKSISLIFSVTDKPAGKNYSIYITKVKAEYGSIATDWSPSYYDYTTLTEFNVRATQIDGQVSAINNSLGGTKTDLANLNTWTQNQINSVNNGLTSANNKIYAIQTAGFITQATGNSLYASAELANGDKIISYINQNATTTTIQSSKINLVGAVTFSMIGGSYHDNSQLAGIASTATSAYNTANTANSTANTANNTANTANSTANTANSTANAINTNWNTKVANAVLGGKTLIAGGYINTSLIDVNNLSVKQAASIGGIWNLSGNAIAATVGSQTTSMSAGSIFLKDTYAEIRLDTNSTEYSARRSLIYAEKLDAVASPNGVSMLLELKHGSNVFDVGTFHYSGDTAYVNRTFIRVSRLPTASNWSTFPNLTGNTASGTYTLKYNADKGLIYIA